MKPFNLEAALAGAKVMTGDKKPVTDIAYFPSISGVYKVGVVIDGGVLFFTETGHISNKSPDPLMDLFMAPVMKEGWISVYKGGRPGIFIYKTKEDALASGWAGPIACVRIEWEE
jgi:hypothetical protein